jgi:hypothetical protein
MENWRYLGYVNPLLPDDAGYAGGIALGIIPCR